MNAIVRCICPVWGHQTYVALSVHLANAVVSLLLDHSVEMNNKLVNLLCKQNVNLLGLLKKRPLLEANPISENLVLCIFLVKMYENVRISKDSYLPG